MSEKTIFAVPKDRLEVAIRLGNGVSLEGDIFLDYPSGSHSLHEKIIAFLESESAFFPIKVRGTGNTEFVNKSTVRMVEVKAPDTNDRYFLPGDLHTFPVSLYLSFSTTLFGYIIADVPVEKTRLSDVLNLPKKFLTLRTASTMCYLNKNIICKVVHEQV
jgi:hypothetical protein